VSEDTAGQGQETAERWKSWARMATSAPKRG